MKELKFRFWCKSENRFVCDPWITASGRVHCMDGISGSDDVTNDIVVQQSIGMKDKAGRTIYEGDIIIHDALSFSFEYGTEHTHPLEVVLLTDDNKWTWGLKRENEQPMYNIWNGRQAVVIGNIFEYKK